MARSKLDTQQMDGEVAEVSRPNPSISVVSGLLVSWTLRATRIQSLIPVPLIPSNPKVMVWVLILEPPTKNSHKVYQEFKRI